VWGRDDRQKHRPDPTHPGDPFIPEFFMESTKWYVELAVAANGPILYRWILPIEVYQGKLTL
jgi:hypothetical protein